MGTKAKKMLKIQLKTTAVALVASILAGAMTTPVFAAKKAKDGDTVQVTSAQAITYPPDTKNNIPAPAYYPLPKGTVDTVTGKRIKFTKNDKVYYYYTLESGVRVNAADVKVIDEDAPSRNKISGYSVESDDEYTYVTINTDQKVIYTVKYSDKSMSFTFKNTSSVPDSQEIPNNPLFSSAKWKKKKLTLTFKDSAEYMGYKGYYTKNGNLVLRFNNPPRSIDQVRVVVDAGHGGKDFGAMGSNSAYHEKDINRLLAQYLTAELESRGAQVYFLDAAGIEGQQRKETAEDWGANFFVSIHCNSAGNTAATGTEVYYFHSFNKDFAKRASAEVSSRLGTNNRGAKLSYYHVSLSSQMKSIMVETGFISNPGEYSKLIQESYQKEVAVGIADAIEKSI